jgi:hypothetical protein
MTEGQALIIAVQVLEKIQPKVVDDADARADIQTALNAAYEAPEVQAWRK